MVNFSCFRCYNKSQIAHSSLVIQRVGSTEFLAHVYRCMALRLWTCRILPENKSPWARVPSQNPESRFLWP